VLNGAELNNSAGWTELYADSMKVPAAEEKRRCLKSAALRKGKERIAAERTARKSFNGICKYTQRIDKAVIQGHMVQVYNTMSREETQIRAQPRTNHVGLNRYKWRVKLQDSARCGVETMRKQCNTSSFNARSGQNSGYLCNRR
jgi:hypothetical protein